MNLTAMLNDLCSFEENISQQHPGKSLPGFTAMVEFNCLIFFSFADFPHYYVIMWDSPTDRFNDFNLFKIFDPGPMVTAIIKHFIHQVALARRQRRESNCHLPTCLPHTVEASHCPF